MDYCTYYAAYRLEEAGRVPEDSNKRLGIFNWIWILFSATFSFMV